MAKDFKTVNTGRLFDAIQTATAEETQEIQETQEINPAQNEKNARKTRKEYSNEEAQEFMNQLKTSGHKGVKLPRVNLAFAPDVYEYIKTMSRVRGENMTVFVNLALRQYMNDHRELYDKAIEFREALDNL